ncbi:MAG: DUF928 domain-containing protein [Phormidesmis sp.]
MTKLKLTFIRLKTTSAAGLGLALLVAAIASQPAHAQVTPTEDSPTENLVASTTRAFIPPSNPRRRGNRTTTGTRQGSCVGDSETAFTILGPSETVGLTTSTRPEFVWYLPPSETTYPVQFRLLASDAQGVPTFIYSTEFSYTEGFMQYQLPAEEAPLSPDIEYRWQVVVVCDENYLSRAIAQERSFEVITPSASLQQSLAAATTEDESALAYGEAGIWYDAITQVARSTDPQSIAVRQRLLTDLAAIEADDEQLSKDLTKIAEIAD